MNNPFSILIVGGGVSSLLACQQLFTIKNFSCSIRIIHSNSNFPKGIAYSPKSDRLLLNVPAGKMSLKLDEPNHFVEWLSKQEDISLEISQLSEEFVPRLVYGNYIEFVWENLLQQVDKSIHTLEIICDEVVGLTKNNSSEYQCITRTNSFNSNAVILATGNASPRNPTVSRMEYVHSNRYFQTPWNLSLKSLQPNPALPIVILGTGLSMVDTVIELKEYFPKLQIKALSRNGYSILEHSNNKSQLKISNIPDIQISDSLLEIVSKVNKYRKWVLQNEGSIDQLFQSIRLKTNEIWKTFSEDEKRKFYDRLRHMWGVARHRVPSQIQSQINSLIKVNQLVIHAANILSIDAYNNHLSIEYFDKRTAKKSTIECSYIFNCTGPESDILKMNHDLLNHVQEQGFIQIDPLQLGAIVDHRSLEFISNKGEKQVNLFGMGNLLRGTFWESTALEELKIQANQIKNTVLQHRNYSE